MPSTPGALEALLDLPLAVNIGGREIEVRSIRMRVLLHVWALAEQVGPALAVGDGAALTTLRRPEFVTFLAAAACVERTWLAAQSGEALLALFVAVRQLNAPLFPLPGDGEAMAQAVEQSAAGQTWADLISGLVAKGHRLSSHQGTEQEGVRFPYSSRLCADLAACPAARN